MALFERKQTAKELRSVFDINGVPSFQEFYYTGIYIWKTIYKGYYDAWHSVKAPTINNPNKMRRMSYINTAKAVCSELANLIWAEGCDITVNQKGFDLSNGEVDPLNFYIQKVLKDNNFIPKMREVIESELALGGSLIRAYADGKKDEEGNLIKGTENVKLTYYKADKFVPISWDNVRITEGVFIEKIAKKGLYYTKLEWHKWNGEEYVVSNELYRNNTSQDILGVQVPLNEIYNIPENVPMRNIDGALFSYFAPAGANNIDDNSPLGISIYANALDTLKALDIAFDSFIREMVLGRKRIIVPASAVRTVRDTKGNEHRYFDANDEAYEALSVDSLEQLKITDNTVEIRIDEHIKAINSFLDILCLQIGLSAGTLSFDKATGLKTATEVVSENSKTFRTVQLMQEPLRASIEQTISAILNIAQLYDVKFVMDGKEYSVSQLVSGGWELSVHFDDSVIQDKDADINRGVLLCNSGLMSKRKFMKEMLGYTDSEIDAELENLKAEAPTGDNVIRDIDWSSIGV